MTSRISRRALAVAVLLGLTYVKTASAANSTRMCYFPDGTESPSDFPCSDSEITHCCNSQNACLSIGYCLSAEQQPYVLSRGSCTDDAWGTGCPSKCAGTSDNPGGGRPISWLGEVSGTQQYCCGGIIDSDGEIACENNASSFTLGTSELLFGVAILTNTTNTTAATASTSASPSLAAQCSGTGSSDSDSSSGSSSDSNSSSKTTAVGAGVGVSLGVVALASLSWAFWERRKRLQILQSLQGGNLPAEMYGDGAATGTTMSPGSAAFGKVYHDGHALREVPAELSAYPHQELPPQQHHVE